MSVLDKKRSLFASHEVMWHLNRVIHWARIPHQLSPLDSHSHTSSTHTPPSTSSSTAPPQQQQKGKSKSINSYIPMSKWSAESPPTPGNVDRQCVAKVPVSHPSTRKIRTPSSTHTDEDGVNGRVTFGDGRRGHPHRKTSATHPHPPSSIHSHHPPIQPSVVDEHEGMVVEVLGMPQSELDAQLIRLNNTHTPQVSGVGGILEAEKE